MRCAMPKSSLAWIPSGSGHQLLAADCRAVRTRSDGRQPICRSYISLHECGLGRKDSHGSVLALCDAETHRIERQVRYCVCQRYRSRPPRHRDQRKRVAASESLPFRVCQLFCSRIGPIGSKDVAVGKTAVSSSMIDRVSARLGRQLYEVPVGF